jgi:hypothetical protein
VTPLRSRRRALTRTIAGSAAAISAAIALTAALLTTGAGAYEGAPWFEPGAPYDQNFPDPAIIEVDGVYHAYATSTGGASLPVMTSTDLRSWTARGDALGTGPSWSPVDGWGRTNLWAPTVVELPDHSFMAAFAVRTGGGDRRCIATAHATSPLGPFHTAESGPFVCEPDPNGAIDPFLVVDDDGVPWLVWKNEGVPVGHPTLASRRTAFWSRPLTDDGRSWRNGSSVHFLLETTESARPWQGTVIENPSLVRFEDSWYLFYSANQWDSAAYAVGFAVCAGPAGPCHEPTTAPVTTSDGTRLGPGAPAPVVGPDGWLWLGYQAWNPPFTSYPSFPACDTDADGECTDGGQRFLHVDRLCVSPTAAFLHADDARAFCDVDPGTYYADPVTWLRDRGVTTGMTPTVFGSDLPVTRAQMAAFLWRLMGEPTGAGPSPFADVAAGRYYAEAVAWLFDRAVTTGTAATTYAPAEPVTRAQMAAFLCRLTRTADYVSSGAPTPGC